MSYRVPDDVAWVSAADVGLEGPAVYLLRVPDGRPVVLEGPAASIWTLAITGADPVSGIAEVTGEPTDVVESATLTFLAELVGRGLLLPPNPDQWKAST